MIRKLLSATSRRFTRKRGPARHGSQDLLSAHFDGEWYRASYPDLGEVDDLLGHYLERGWREGRDPAEGFSVSDYLETYPDVRAAGVEPFGHYLANGRKEAREARPSRKSSLRAQLDFHERTGVILPGFPADEFRWGAYAHAAGIPRADRWQALTHFIEEGLGSPELLAAAEPGPGLLQAIGEAAAEPPNIDLVCALRCLQLAADKGGANPRLYRSLGEVADRLGLPSVARDAYAQAAVLDPDNGDTHVQLARAFERLGDLSGAIGSLDRAIAVRPSRSDLRFDRNLLARQRFFAGLSAANALATRAADTEAAAEIDRALAEYLATVDRPSDAQVPPLGGGIWPPRVAVFGLETIPQCRLYRIQQKLEQLAIADVPTELYSQDEAERMLADVGRFDALIVYRLPAFPEVIDVLLQARRLGVPTLYDIDDLIFDAELYPPSRDHLSNISAIEYAGLVTGRSLYREAIALCDYGIASTPPLQAAMAARVRSGVCFLSPNALGEAHMAALPQLPAKLPLGPGDPFIILYGSGTTTHNADFALAAPAVAAVLRRNRHARLHVIGPVDIGTHFAGLEGQVKRLGFMPNLTAYWSEVARADVNLAPLTVSGFNDAKSEIKWMEAAMGGVPSIVSWSATYEQVIADGVDGFIARTPADWNSLLERLIADRPLARRVGEAARARVLADYSLETGSEVLVGALRQAIVAPPARTRPLVLAINVFYPPEYIGGATRIIEQNVADLRARYGDEFDLEVFCRRLEDGKPGVMDRYQWDGVTVTSISPFGDDDLIERSVETETAFEAYLASLKPDLVHIHCIQGLSASIVDVIRRAGIPYVVTAHDGWWICDRQFLIDDRGVPVERTGKWGDRRRLDRLRECLLGAEATIAVSETHARLYRSRGITNTITIENCAEKIAGVAPPPADGPVWIGLIAGFTYEKGVDLLREALERAHFRNLRFLVVDHRMAEGEERCEWWGSNVIRIVGKTAFGNVGKLYEAIHVLLAPSVCVESFGLVTREAARLGRWVVASNRGALAECVTPEVDGFVIDPARIEDLLGVLETIERDPERFRGPPPERAAKWREREDVADDLAALYRSVLAAQPAVANEV